NDRWQEVFNSLDQFLIKGHISLESCGRLLDRLDVLIGELSRDAGEQGESLGLRLVVRYQELLHLVCRQVEKLEILRELSLNLTSTLDLSAVLEKIAAEAMRLVEHASTVNIFLFQEGALHFGAARDRLGVRDKPFAEPRPHGLTYAVARSGEMIIVEDMRTHPLFQDAPDSWDGSIIGIPLKAGSGVVGVMNLSRAVRGSFTAKELNFLQFLADRAALAIRNALLHQSVSQQAYTDPLTGLPNRRALDEFLEREISLAQHQRTSLCVIMMDLDGFKYINDAYGHVTGDKVLQAVTRHLQHNLRTSDFLARYGGDELTLVLSKTTLLEAQKVASKVRHSMSEFHYLLDGETQATLSISGGIAAYPMHALSASDLLRAADQALYRAKRRYRGEFLVATPLKRR
ncbi:MAG: diguanylate cyclase, partial [Anaerolineales bacterium]